MNMVKVLSDLLMKTNKNLQKKSQSDFKLQSQDYFLDIDELPLWNWIQCTNGQKKFVRKDLKKGNEQKDNEVWSVIYDSYLNEFGLTAKHKKMLEAIKKQTQLQLEYVMTLDNFKLTQIQMQIEKMKSMVNNANSGMSIEQALVHVSKWLNQWLNSKTITTREWFNILKEYERAMKIEQSQNRKK
jgi:hypothetical protein